jgi:TonB family protein
VNKEGEVVDVEVMRGVKDAPMLDAEAVRVVKMMPKWTPGRMGGKPVRTRFVLPITFKFDDKKKDEKK